MSPEASASLSSAYFLYSPTESIAVTNRLTTLWYQAKIHCVFISNIFRFCFWPFLFKLPFLNRLLLQYNSPYTIFPRLSKTSAKRGYVKTLYEVPRFSVLVECCQMFSNQVYTTTFKSMCHTHIAKQHAPIHRFGGLLTMLFINSYSIYKLCTNQSCAYQCFHIFLFHSHHTRLNITHKHTRADIELIIIWKFISSKSNQSHKHRNSHHWM